MTDRKQVCNNCRALPEGESDPMDFMERTRTQSKADKSAPAADVPQASTQTELYESCLRRSSGLCVLALLDASSASHAEHAKITSEAAGRWGRQPLHFSWIDAARQVRTVVHYVCVFMHTIYGQAIK